MKSLVTIASATLLASGASFVYAQEGEFAETPFTITISDGPNTTATNTEALLGFSQAEERPAPFLNVQAWVTGTPATVEFRNWSNYNAFIRRAEVVILDAAGETLSVVPVAPGNATIWKAPAGLPANVQYYLRAYDAHGRMDMTSPKSLDLGRVTRPDAGAVFTAAQVNSLAVQNIRLSGQAVVASGAGVARGDHARFMGAEVPVDPRGAFSWAQILPQGPQLVTTDIIGSRGQVRQERMEEVSIAASDWFYVAIADVTVGQNSATGPIEAATGMPFDDRIYVDGRLAFYLKGKIKGEWLLTASADTGEGPVESLFNNVLGKDPQSVLRRIDPDQYYPVYGDGSTSVDDAPTDGKLFVRLQKDGADILWGNFKTRTPETGFSGFSRALYGGRAAYVTPDSVSRGEPRGLVEVFAAEPGTQQSREIYRGTGGSLYYLRNRDIMRGSERVYIETRDATTGVVLDRRELREVIDYEINTTQGRIQLSQPLASSAVSGMLVSGANPQYLVVSYEYSPGLSVPSQAVLGGSAAYWLGENLRVGTSALRETDAGVTQTVAGVDAKAYFADNSFVTVEAARTLNGTSNGWQSFDGGFTFTAVQGGVIAPSADAKRAEVSVDLRDFGASDGRIGLVWQDRQAGFAGPGMETDQDTTQIQASFEKSLGDRTSMRLSYDSTASTSQNITSVEGNLEFAASERLRFGVGVKSDNVRTIVPSASPALSTDGDRTDAVARVDYDVSEGTSVYGYAQKTLQRTGTRALNDRYGIGAEVRASDRLGFGGEVSTGTGGIGASLNGTWQINDNNQVYLSYGLSPAQTGGTDTELTFGGRSRLSDSLYFVGEQNYISGTGSSGRTSSVGFDYTPADGWQFGLQLEAGNLSDPIDGDIARQAASLSGTYTREDMRISSKLEYRRDAGADLRETWLSRSALSYSVDDNWRLLGNLDYAVSVSSAGPAAGSEYVEGIIGYAYRPVENDRLNMLFKYTYLYDTGAPEQVGAGGAAWDYAQRSHVLSADADYEITPKLTVGAKVGLRFGALKDTSVAGSDWQTSDARLAILRADWEFANDWGLLVEGRYLDTPAVQSNKAGALLGVYRQLGDNFRVGAGYNMTGFSDDLTNQDYTSQGWFLNIVGSM